jgi:ligand-binding sensor domain-containing protein
MTRDLYWSRDGVLWIATEAGASRFDGRVFTTYNTGDGLPNNSVFGMAEDQRGNLWLSPYRSGITRYDGETFKTYTVDDGLADNTVGGFLHTGADSLWIHFIEAGVGSFDGERFAHYTVADGLAHNRVFSLSPGRDGHIWVGTAGRASRFDGFAFQNLLKRDGLSSNVVTDVLADQNGYIWIATSGDGITRLKPTAAPPPIFMPDVITDVRHGPVGNCSGAIAACRVASRSARSESKKSAPCRPCARPSGRAAYGLRRELGRCRRARRSSARDLVLWRAGAAS